MNMRLDDVETRENELGNTEADNEEIREQVNEHSLADEASEITEEVSTGELDTFGEQEEAPAAVKDELTEEVSTVEENDTTEETADEAEEITDEAEEITEEKEEELVENDAATVNDSEITPQVVTNTNEAIDKQPKENKEKKEKSNNTLSKIIIALLIVIIIILMIRSCGVGKDSGNNGDNTPGITGSVDEGTNTPKPTKPAGSDNFEEEGDAWDGTNETVFKETEQEFITFPGFSYIAVNEENREVQLFNYPENTVYFRYVITETLNTENIQSFEFGSYDTDEEKEKAKVDAYKLAKNYVKSVEKKYEPKKEDGRYFFMLDGTEYDTAELYNIKETTNGFTVIKETERLVFCTANIGPGKAVKWNVYDTLGAGDYTVNLRVDTLDEKSKVECWGVNQVIDVHVE